MALRARAERLEAHHKVPIEELQPDSITPVTEMAMVCATCHRVIHSAKPCLTIEQVRALGKLALAIGVSAEIGRAHV